MKPTMSTLNTDSRFASPDAAFRALVEAHRDLSDASSAALNARLVLILANHIGDHAVLEQAIALAKIGTATNSSNAGSMKHTG